jgi:DNA-binding LytR/AlgR family response regulator
MKATTKILIVEDEVIIAEYILELLNDEKFNNVKMVHERDEAIVMMNSFLPNVILMDININGVNSGIELAKIKNEEAKVIFLTGQYDYTLMNEALSTNPDSYLTKPIKKNDLIAAINLAIFKQKVNYILLKDGYDIVKINFDDILYIKSDSNYIDIQTTTKRYVNRQSLSVIVESLPPETFKQTHRSYIINITKVTRITTTAVYMDNIEIPLSRTFAKQFK